ncbi:YceD family protein [Shimia marina]|uniref:ACR n=1 Tax=Shimia marina TaxID=321267 RepID=A0A0P1EPB9_9RHOB|nr:DUF177 domain-containing protein [Shimia marina]CUH51938.1 hypothetical protein SHM7688_01378 [Shimia marina]SFE45189.1 Uncharacterized metal-binding protein YceD, DUF177 family [Shimia marina]
MSQSSLPQTSLRVADLPQNRPTAFEIKPDTEALTTLAAELDIQQIKKLVFTGEVRAFGASDWELKGQLGATVVQPCVVTLSPVTTRLDEPVERRFLKTVPEFSSDEEEVEMPDDENAEPLQSHIDLNAVLQEALALLIPQFPRAQGAQLKESVFTEAGKKAMTDEDARPFAGLSALRDQLTAKDDE